MTAERRAAKRQVRKGISIVGAGNWGSSLAAAVLAAGIPLLEVVIRKNRGRREFGDAVVVPWRKAVLGAEILWICVSDKEIAAVAKRIAAQRDDLRGQLVIHSSGALTVEVLEAVERAGAKVGAVAPIFSFPTREPVALAGVIFAVEAGSDAGPSLTRKLAALVRKLGGRPLRISSESKLLYHAAATMASPLLVSALESAVATARLAGLEKRDAEAVVRGLATATLRNFFEKGAEGSFSGPFARGDTNTVELHLQALLEHPRLNEVYLALARNAAASLPVRNMAELQRVLGSNTARSSGKQGAREKLTEN